MNDLKQNSNQTPDCATCNCCFGDEEEYGSMKFMGIEGALCRACVASAFHCGGRKFACIDCPELKVKNESMA